MDHHQRPRIPYTLTVAGLGGEPGLREPEVAAKVAEIIAAERAGLASSGAELRLASLGTPEAGFAELVRREVLRQEPGGGLLLVLPLARAEEEARSPDPEALAQLCDRAWELRTMRKEPLAAQYPSPLQQEAVARARLKAGRHIIQHADVVIFLEDPAAPLHATRWAQLRGYADQVERPYWVIPAADPAAARRRPGRHGSPRLAQRLAAFNRRLAPVDRREQLAALGLGGEAIRDLDRLLPAACNEYLDRQLLPAYAAASLQANRYQQVYRRAGLAAFTLSFLATAVVAFGAVLWGAPGWVFLLEALLLGGVVSVIWRANRLRSHRNWMECRFLAERLRGLFFVLLGGAAPEAPPAYLLHDRGEPGEEWVRLVRRHLAHQAQGLGWERLDHRTAAGLIRQGWVADQISYLGKKAEGCRRAARRLENAAQAAFFLALAGAVVHFAVPLLHPPAHHWPLGQALTLAALLLPMAGATLGALLSHREYKHLAATSSRVEASLKAVDESFDLLTPQKLRHLVRKLDRLLEQENSQWMVLVDTAELKAAV
jgi:hypothetical protein